jgi:hypothetical protein
MSGFSQNVDGKGWKGQVNIKNRSFTCGYCSKTVSSILGSFFAANEGNGQPSGWAYICPNCKGLNIWDEDGRRYPTPLLGEPIDHVPAPLTAAYNEARRCTWTGCYTASVLLCRKMLMNIAVEQHAKEGLTFKEYITYLSEAGFVPPNGKAWVDHIKDKGNEATHAIALMKEEDARDLLTFIGMLLRFIYEFPAMVPAKPPKP